MSLAAPQTRRLPSYDLPLTEHRCLFCAPTLFSDELLLYQMQSFFDAYRIFFFFQSKGTNSKIEFLLASPLLSPAPPLYLYINNPVVCGDEN